MLQQLGGLYHRAHAPFYNPEISVQILTKSLESGAQHLLCIIMTKTDAPCRSQTPTTPSRGTSSGART